MKVNIGNREIDLRVRFRDDRPVSIYVANPDPEATSKHRKIKQEVNCRSCEVSITADGKEYRGETFCSPKDQFVRYIGKYGALIRLIDASGDAFTNDEVIAIWNAAKSNSLSERVAAAKACIESRAFSRAERKKIWATFVPEATIAKK